MLMCHIMVKTLHLQHVSIFHRSARRSYLNHSVYNMKDTTISKFILVYCSKIWYFEQHTEV